MIDSVFNHPNLPPFVALRLIRSMVTSNPCPAYVARVSSVFINNGGGVRGDLARGASRHPARPRGADPDGPSTAA